MSYNIAMATESVDTPTHTTEISLLICEQMEITGFASGGTYAVTPYLNEWNAGHTKTLSGVTKTNRLVKLFDLHHREC